LNIAVLYPWVLSLLLLSIVPLFSTDVAVVRFSSLALIPDDRVSTLIAMILRVARSASLALVAIGLSGPYLPEKQIERIGEGAQIILLLDRSRSMDQPFGGQPFRNPLITEDTDAKGTVARRLLSEFVADRRNDKYGMLVFSTEPIQVLPLTDKTEIIQAAIDAGNIGRGLSETNVGAGIIAAIRFFEGQPYTGSRVVMLVSDGGARLDKLTRIHIADLLERHRVALYWVYIRSRHSPGIVPAGSDEQRDDTAPARVLHEYFETLETPYRVFDAEDPNALATAIAKVNELQSLPIRYVDVIPRKKIGRWFYVAGMALITMLLFVERTEIRRW
jgi:mxaC protein